MSLDTSSNLTIPRTDGSPRLLMLAYSCHPHTSMEDRNGWNRALHATSQFKVTVLCAPGVNTDELRGALPSSVDSSRIRFIAVPTDRITCKSLASEWLFYWGYRRWLKSAYQLAKRLHTEAPFSLTHLVSLCGYREPGYIWRLNCPFVWGPIGGTSGFPLRYLGITDWPGGFFEVARNLINYLQLRMSFRIRRAARNSAAVIAANGSTKYDLERHLRIRAIQELETGIDFPFPEPRRLRSPNEPLRILWAGRLRTWKALPLLLHALASLPKDFQVTVRVVGDGKCKTRWQNLAKRLSVDHLIEWLPRPAYRDSFVHYRWADIFAFTSLRDTSGTGLLESLAFGTPIVGLEHQGAADIMDESSSIGISVSRPAETIQRFVEAFTLLANDPLRLKALSDGALARAREFAWEKRCRKMSEVYSTVCDRWVAKEQLSVHPPLCPIYKPSSVLTIDPPVSR